MKIGVEEEEEEENFSQFLASSSDDKTIRIWSIKCDEEIKCYLVPGHHLFQANSSSSSSSSELASTASSFSRISNNKMKSQQQQQAMHSTSNNKISYTPLCWPNPCSLVFGNYNGDLNRINLVVNCDDEKMSANKKNNSELEFFESGKLFQPHRKQIFEIKYFRNSLITIALDKYVSFINFI